MTLTVRVVDEPVQEELMQEDQAQQVQVQVQAQREQVSHVVPSSVEKEVPAKVNSQLEGRASSEGPIAPEATDEPIVPGEPVMLMYM